MNSCSGIKPICFNDEDSDKNLIVLLLTYIYIKRHSNSLALAIKIMPRWVHEFIILMDIVLLAIS